jgi:hypothetical protein
MRKQFGRESRERARQRARRWMALIFTLLPGVLAVGLLAPQMVRVAPAQERQAPSGDAQPLFRPPPLRKPPLLPKELSSRSSVLVDLNNLFSQSFAPSDRQLSRVGAFPKNSGELIALDDVHEEMRDVLFKDALAAAIIPRTQLPGSEPFLPLINPLPASNGLRYDDFPAPGSGADAFTTPVPEPGTALMVGLGLLAIALTRRGQRQPTTR